MITSIYVNNYRSFVEAEATLGSFTLVIGANGSGKSNFLRLFRDLNAWDTAASYFRLSDGSHPNDAGRLMPHFNGVQIRTSIHLTFDDGSYLDAEEKYVKPSALHYGHLIEIIRINPDIVSAVEKVGAPLIIRGNGWGVANAIDAFKTGVGEEIFGRIMRDLHDFIPELTSIGLAGAGEGQKWIVGREESILTPVPGWLLSDGTRTILALLTIIHQPSPPPLLLIEDLDHAMHPRLFEEVVGFLRRICEERKVQIIATTHNPYLLDCFNDDPDSVLLIEKEGGGSRIVPIGEEIRRLREKGSPASMALSKLYLSGFLSESAASYP